MSLEIIPLMCFLAFSKYFCFDLNCGKYDRTLSYKFHRAPAVCSSARSGWAWWMKVACHSDARRPADNYDNLDPAPPPVPESLLTPGKKLQILRSYLER